MRLAPLLSVLVGGVIAAQPQVPSDCARALVDRSVPGECIGASSAPLLGTLLPLGPEFFVSPTGAVGIGTTAPATTLEVNASSGGGFRVADQGQALLGVDAATGTLTLGLPGWDFTGPVVATLPDASPGLNFRNSSGQGVFSIDPVNRRVGVSGGGADVSLPLYPLHVQHNAVDATSLTVARFLTDVVTPADSDGYYTGAWSTARVPVGSANFTGALYGLTGDASCGGSGTVAEAVGLSGFASEYGGGTLADGTGVSGFVASWDGHIDAAYGFRAWTEAYAPGTITDAYGLHVASPSDPTGIANHYGVYIETPGAASAAWALYAEGGDSYFGGNVGLGDAAPTNVLTVAQGSATDPIADAWLTYSSRRWKTNVEPIEDALDKVLRLRGVTYDWRESGRHDVGFIAEEVGEVIPEVVQFEDDGESARSVDYARLTAVLVEAVKAQQAEIDELRTELRELAGRMD